MNTRSISRGLRSRVVCFHVVHQAIVPDEGLVADRTEVVLDRVMLIHVLSQAVFAHKRRIANIAFIRSQPCMLGHVHFVGASLEEVFAAVRTFKVLRMR